MATKVLVLGGGFAGLEAARRLSRHRESHHLSIQLIDRHRWSLFAPLLPDLISGRIDPHHIAYPLEPFCRRHGVQFTHAEVTYVDPRTKVVQTTAGAFQADFIIICVGCETNYRGHDEWSPRVPGLKSLVEGIEVRMKARSLLDGKAGEEDRTGHIIVCGAGYTGFEVASHMALYMRHLTQLPFAHMRRKIRILLLEDKDKVLKNTTPGVQKWAAELIGRFGVEILRQVTVKGLPGPGEVELTDGSRYRDSVLIWTAGVTPGKACRAMPVDKTHNYRLTVDRHLMLPGHDGVFAAGDVAGPIPPGADRPLRMSVQFSLTGGRCAAANVIHAIDGVKPKEYDPADLGYVVPLGPGQAIGVVLGREMHGRIPFMLHYMMSTYRSRGLTNKFAVMTDLFREILPYPSMNIKQKRTDQVHEPFMGSQI
jgi:NADH:ubiquinone reductase (H+-translocating)